MLNCSNKFCTPLATYVDEQAHHYSQKTRFDVSMLGILQKKPALRGSFLPAFCQLLPSRGEAAGLRCRAHPTLCAQIHLARRGDWREQSRSR